MEVPEKPLNSDCCGSGCTPCVFDVYEELLRRREVSKDEANSKRNLRTDLLSVLKYKAYKLLEIEAVTENVNIYTFMPLVESTNQLRGILPYKPGQHFIIINDSKDVKGQTFSRSYTPISLTQTQPNCEVKFLIKLYKDGAMSKRIAELSTGDVMYMRGAFGNFSHVPGSKYFFICSGTGIAPVYAVVKSILLDDGDETTIKLWFTCRTPKDIYFRQEIREFCKFWNFTARVFVSRQDTVEGVRHDENIETGRITEDGVHDEILARGNCKVLICGSESFNSDMKAYVERSGIPEEDVFVF